MAVVTTNVLSITFATQDGSTSTIRISQFNPEATELEITDLADGFVANGQIFKNVPVMAKSAKIVATTTTDVNIDG